MTNIALIMAAGRGTRMGTDLPKQYLPLAGQPVLRRTVQLFLKHPRINRVAIVASPDDTRLCKMAIGDLPIIGPVHGGESRQQSVLNGLMALQSFHPSRVLVHDAARPFVSPQIIDNVLDALDSCDAVLPTLPVTDTLKRGADGMVNGTIDRDTVFRAQTPQGFSFQHILPAHQAAIGQQLTDDISVAEHAGIAARMVPGSETNFKITTLADMQRAEHVLAGENRPATQRTVVAQGFDVHRFAPARRLVLCGIDIPHDMGLAGHSDADVAMHAVTDAVLGTVGAGDIGHHFPPGDEKWRGVASDTFLRHACELVARRDGQISHIDLMIICERPKIGQYREDMRRNLANICNIPMTRVSIKATTTEKLGFTGRGEGIASTAVATVILPEDTA